MLAAAAVMIPTVWLPDLKALSYLGVCGITATATVATTVRILHPRTPAAASADALIM